MVQIQTHQLFRLIEVQELTDNFEQWNPARTLKYDTHRYQNTTTETVRPPQWKPFHYSKTKIYLRPFHSPYTSSSLNLSPRLSWITINPQNYTGVNFHESAQCSDYASKTFTVWWLKSKSAMPLISFHTC